MAALLMLIGALIVEQKWIEFTQPVGSWAAGTIEPFSRAIADGYILAGQAKEADPAQHLRASLAADGTRQFAAFEERLSKLLERGGNGSNGHANGHANGHPGGAAGTIPRRPQPPGGDGVAEFGNIPRQETIVPSKLDAMGRNFHCGQMVKALMCTMSRDVAYEHQEWGRNLLRNLYTVQRVEYQVAEESEPALVFPGAGGTEVGRTGTSSISGGPTYGFLVRPEWEDTLFRIPIEESVIEDFCYRVPVGQALEFRVPSLDQYGVPKSGQAAGYANFELHRRGEITQRPYSDGKLNEIAFKVTDLTAFTTWSRDLDADAFIRMGAFIQQVLGQAFIWKKDYEFLLGNGVGMPLGILNGGQGNTDLHPSVLLQQRFAANMISYNDIVRMMQRIYPAYWKEMYWLTNAAQTLEHLAALKDDQGAYVYQPNSLVGQWNTPTIMGEGPRANRLWWRAEGRLQGRPVIFSEKIPQLGTVGDLILLNPREAYGVATRQGLEMGMSEHFLFDTDRIAVRWKLRNDGQPMLKGPYIQSDGGITTGNSRVSWCCVLQ